MVGIPANPAITLDVFESSDMEALLSKTLSVTRMNLVPTGMGDIVWHCGHWVSLEHKDMQQTLAEMGGRLDNQLRKHTQHAEEVGLVIHGFATPIPNKRACYVWERDKKGGFQRKGRYDPKTKKYTPIEFGRSWEELQAYLWRLDKMGITVYQAPDLPSLCLAISAFVYNSFKSEHKTLERYIKTKPIMWEPDPYVETLMGIAGARIGEVSAKKLIEAYGTPYRAFLAQEDKKWPLGKVAYQLFKKGLGRS